jgi:hypothetical protein
MSKHGNSVCVGGGGDFGRHHQRVDVPGSENDLHSDVAADAGIKSATTNLLDLAAFASLF